jgi:PKD repeat protein
VAGGPYGVFVNNRHKYRIANNLIGNQQGDGGGAYDNNGGKSDLKLTGGQMLAARWLDMHNMGGSNSSAFPNESGHSYSTLRNSHDRYYNFVRDWFTKRRIRGTHWQDGMWQHGDYLCGNSNAIYNAGKCGNTYSLYSHQKAYHTGSPELHDVGTYDWYRMFATYYIRAQDRNASNNDGRSSYGDMGRISDSYCEVHSVTCAYGNGHMSSIMGGLVLTPAVFNPKPVAQGSVSTTQVTEGCVPGNGQVEFSHSDSFHPNSDARITTFYWDANQADGLWWETGANPDLDINGNALRTNNSLAVLTYVYARRGTYTPTLRVEDNSGQTKSMTLSQITVGAAADVPPSIATGGPYLIEVGDNLILNGSASDGNSACGDRTTVTWNIDYELENLNNRNFETQGEGATVNWNGGVLSQLPRNQALTIQVQVSDQFTGNNEAPIESTTLFIYDRDPVVEARVNPTEAACRQQITFDASDSYHPNPQRTIANFQWEIDGRTSDRSIFTTNFPSFGERQARVTVTDDLGRSSNTTLNFKVNQGNLPPNVRVTNDQITVMSNAAIALDARQSFEPNADCGDRIVAYEWDMLADGLLLNGGVGIDFNGAQVQIPAAAWQEAMGWDGNDSMVIRLTLRDTLGATATHDIVVNAVRAEPVPRISQVPNPASFRVDNGSSSVRLDGRESSSLLEGVSITRYEWDIGCDDSYEREQGQFLYERVFPQGTRLADIQANPVTVCLRVTDSNGNIAVSAPYTINYQELGNTDPFADADPSDAPEVGYNMLEGEGVTLDASSSFDPDSEDFDDFIRQYAWSVNGNDGGVLTVPALDENDVAAQTLTLSAGQLAGYGIVERGEYEVSLQVTDTSNNLGNDTTKITVHRDGSDINVVINPVNASPNSRITFDASRSEHTHPDIDVNQVIWFFGDLVVVGGGCNNDQDCVQGYCITNPADNELTCMDGSLGSQEGEVVNRTFDTITPEEGEAIGVTVVVRDTNGGQSQSSDDGDFNDGDDGNDTRFGIRVDQGNRLPVANPGGGTDVGGDDVVGAYTIIDDDDQRIVFDGSASADPDADFGDAITDYTWTIGTCVCSTELGTHNNCPVAQNEVGATLPELSLSQLTQCQIDGGGTYEIRLTVTDRFGQSATSSTNLNVVDGPQAFAQADPGRTGCEQVVTFDGRGSNSAGPAEQGFNIVSYEWDLNGDGETDFSNPIFEVPVTAEPTGNPPRVILNARLTVTNAIGAALIAAGEDPGPHQSIDDIEVIIDVQNLPPVANPGGVYRTGGNNGVFAPVTVDGRGSIDPNAPCDSIQDYWWDTDGDELYGCDDNDGPITIDGQRCDYVGATVSFSNASWQPNTTASVGLKVRDQFGVWSEPSNADIIVDNVIPPSGEVLSPRVSSCATNTGGGNSTAQILVRHPDPNPQPVLVDVLVAGQVAGSVRVANFNAQQEAIVEIPLNLNGIPQGLHEVVASFTLESNRNSHTEANSGGRVTFDFTPPVITIGAQPADNICYQNGRVPAAEVDVEDNFDNAPQVSQSVLEDGCGRTLQIVARDRCGQESIAERPYRVGTAVSLIVAGVAEGVLSDGASARWEVDGLEACASDIEANLSRDGGAGVPYAEDTAINTPGDYTLRLTVWNCIGTPRDQVVNFRVNRPPVSRPRPDGHPNSDINAANGYIVSEGSPLTLDATASTSPEFDDQVVDFVWTIPGQQGLQGPSPALDTNEDGVFNGTLQVTDSLGATHSESVQITITDIDPVVNTGGPYVADQGIPVRFDGSRSRSLNPGADPIVSYTWSWDDGTADSVGAVQEHTFTAQGAYNIRLTVCDEDSCSDSIVGVVIADVDPEIESIFITGVMGEVNNDRPDPVLGYEIVPLTFGVTATAGAPNDPITLYQWDFDGDNLFDENTEDPSVVWQFMEPGLYNVGVLARDRDSFTFRTQLVDVKVVDFQTTLEYAKYRLDEVINAGNLNILNRARLAQTSSKIDQGIWGQVHDDLLVDPISEYANGALNNPDNDRSERMHLQVQGVTFTATERILRDFTQAQANGSDFGTAIWALSRQLRRELDYDLGSVQADGESRYADRENDPVYSRRLRLAENRLDDVVNLFSDEAFERDSRNLNQPEGLSLNLQQDARRGLDWLTIAVDQCSDPRFGGFQVNDDGSNPAAYSIAADSVRSLAYGALEDMLSEITTYANLGDENNPAPGKVRLLEAANSLALIMDRANENMSFDCQQNCSTNRNALELELEAMNLISALTAAGVEGAYVMHWQSCLVEYLRFRIEASLVAVKGWCGQFNPLYLKAQETFREGEALLTEKDDVISALNFYSDDAQLCLMLDVYNKCLVRVDPDSEFYEYPDVCLE